MRLPVNYHLSNEFPIDTSAAFQEVKAASKSISNHWLDIKTLQHLAFLSSEGKIVTVNGSAQLKDRSEDITYFRFKCDLNSHHFDSRVSQERELSLQFYLKLPQHSFNVDTGSILAIKLSSTTTISRSTISSPLNPSCLNFTIPVNNYFTK